VYQLFGRGAKWVCFRRPDPSAYPSSALRTDGWNGITTGADFFRVFRVFGLTEVGFWISEKNGNGQRQGKGE